MRRRGTRRLIVCVEVLLSGVSARADVCRDNELTRVSRTSVTGM